MIFSLLGKSRIQCRENGCKILVIIFTKRHLSFLKLFYAHLASKFTKRVMKRTKKCTQTNSKYAQNGSKRKTRLIHVGIVWIYWSSSCCPAPAFVLARVMSPIYHPVGTCTLGSSGFDNFFEN